MRKPIILMSLLALTQVMKAQFHTLKIPQASNKVVETQTLGVTDITIDYSSPTVRGRDVWKDRGVIPFNEEPIAWRAGANMNTTISFSTDVRVNGKALNQGKYGLHVIPNEQGYRILFAHANEQWGSYYLDFDNDITEEILVQAESSAFSEKLDYEFYNDSEDQMTIAIEWAEQKLPFQVQVDLNETVIESFRSELRGINTYHWQAWNDAAAWCLNRDVNLEQALTWAKRSINGGYGGFAADQNVTNMTTKYRLEGKLGKQDAANATLEEMLSMNMTAYQSNDLTLMLLYAEHYGKAAEFNEGNVKKYADQWFVHLNYGISLYFIDKQKQAVRTLEKANDMIPEAYQARYKEILDGIKDGTFKLGSS